MSTHRNIVSNIVFRLLVVATVMATLVTIPAWAGKGPGSGITPLSAAEVEVLNYMREEEKLARDVYLEMFGQWNARVFSQISLSEQQHMDTMLKMLDKYGLPDPAEDEFGEINDIGVFNDPDLQNLYDDLITKGFLSYIDGLEVGVIIEVTDLIDLKAAIEASNHVDLDTAYGRLLDGSNNHLASFCDHLETLGVTCDTSDLDPALFDAIRDVY
jgi:hypothetical protein